MLNNPTPITVDPVPAKVFDKLHVYSLSAIQPTTNSGSITVELLPATANGELAPINLIERTTTQLNPEILTSIPELKSAFDAVLAAIPATQAYIAAKQEAPFNE